MIAWLDRAFGALLALIGRGQCQGCERIHRLAAMDFEYCATCQSRARAWVERSGRTLTEPLRCPCGKPSDGWPDNLCQVCWEAESSRAWWESEGGLYLDKIRTREQRARERQREVG